MINLFFIKEKKIKRWELIVFKALGHLFNAHGKGAGSVSAPIAFSTSDIGFQVVRVREEHVGRQVVQVGVTFPEFVRGLVYMAEFDLHQVTLFEIGGCVPVGFRIDGGSALHVGCHVRGDDFIREYSHERQEESLVFFVPFAEQSVVVPFVGIVFKKSFYIE